MAYKSTKTKKAKTSGCKKKKKSYNKKKISYGRR